MRLFSSSLPYVDSVELFDKVADQPWAIFLDSGVINHKQPVNKHADYDVLAIKPDATLVFDNETTYYWNDRKQRQQKLYGDPIALLQTLLPKIDTESASDNDYAYIPGALGYFSYDLARQYEALPVLAKNDENLPEMAVGIYSVIVLVDHRLRQTIVLSLGDSEQTQSLAALWTEMINFSVEFSDAGESESSLSRHFMGDRIDENLTFDQYTDCFDKVRRYTTEGDCYQVNLAKRFSVEIDASSIGDSWVTYRYLRQLSPAPYGAYLNLPFAQVLSNSPENFIQCVGGAVTTSPIKGTRARDHDNVTRDKEIAKELFNSPKDRAENLMIVDLMRNDLSRCCKLGSVKVPKLFSLHSFANVHHLISTVTGTLRQGLHSLDLLRSCFPGGSITGAPKIRAMEIIEELEPHRRGLYCGSIGYVGANGDLQTNIAIRTIVIKGGVIRYSAGGGLVIDSVLEEEYQEIIDKARMMTETLS